MPESSDYTPAPWAARDTFADARASYDKHVDRSYSVAAKKGVVATDLVPDHLKSESPCPIVVLCDVTGSMGSWPATIFSKLPYLDHEAKFYFGEDYEIAFGAIGDAFSDSYPLQMNKFASGKELKDTLTKLVVEGGGGGTSQESYDLGAIYAARNIEMPNAIKPILIFVGDEGLYDTVYPDKAKSCAKVDIQDRLPIADLFKELTQKFEVFVIRKPYNCSGTSNSQSDEDKKIQKQWEGLIGEDHVAPLPEAERVVDVIFGIFAKVTGKIEDFKKELKDRQGKDDDGKHKIEIVLKSLVTIHRDDINAARADKLPHKHSLKKLPHLAAGASVTRRSGKNAGKSSKSLLED